MKPSLIKRRALEILECGECGKDVSIQHISAEKHRKNGTKPLCPKCRQKKAAATRKAEYEKSRHSFVCRRCGQVFTRTDGQIRHLEMRGSSPTYCSSKCKGEHFGELSTRKRLGDEEYDRRTREGLHEFYSLLGALKLGAKSRGIPVEITAEYLRDLWVKQGGCCALSGIPMELVNINARKRHVSSKNKRLTRPFLVSVDRIDSTIGYVEGNVQLVCSIVNLAKNEMSQDMFIQMCIAVAKNQEGNYEINDLESYRQGTYRVWDREEATVYGTGRVVRSKHLASVPV